MDQITIAAIEGFCIGGGIALALDFRMRSTISRATWMSISSRLLINTTLIEMTASKAPKGTRG